jgi:hypothetical protein
LVIDTNKQFFHFYNSSLKLHVTTTAAKAASIIPMVLLLLQHLNLPELSVACAANACAFIAAVPKPVAVVNDICAATPATLIALYVNDRKLRSFGLLKCNDHRTIF